MEPFINKKKFKLLKYKSISFSSIFLLASCSIASTAPSQLASEESSYWNLREPASNSVYKVIGDCDGLPRVNVKTPKGICVGLVSSGDSMVMPRSIMSYENEFFITDMGGWVANRGKVYRLKKVNDSYQLETALQPSGFPASKRYLMDKPHGLALGKDGKIYVGAAGTIFRFDPKAQDLYKSVEVLIEGLPADGRHPLKSILFDAEGRLLVNIGSSTDNCQEEKGNKVCSEAEGNEGRGLIRRYSFNSKGNIDSHFEILARGLRNSVAMALHPETHEIFQGENSRDYIQKANPHLDDENEPNEELNILQEGKNYGWPYCYDDKKVSPEFSNHSCEDTEKPFMLWPAHAAPLSMFFYTGNHLPSWYHHKLIVAFHGYRAKGHRIVAFDQDEHGRPTGSPLNLVYGWENQGQQAMGTPVSLTMASDGSIFLTEDKSKKILRITFLKEEGDGLPDGSGAGTSGDSDAERQLQDKIEKLKAEMQPRLARSKVPLFTQIQSRLINNNCVACHGTLTYPGIQMLAWDDIGNAKKLKEARDGKDPLVIPKKPDKSEFYLRLKGKSAPQMPPGGLPDEDKAELIQLVKDWINQGAPIPK